MADRNVETQYSEVPEIPALVEQLLITALDEGKSIMESGEMLAPFTALAVKNHLFIESYQCDEAQECFDAARKTVEGARGALGYAFCYDGYVETDEGDADVLIAEGGLPGDDDGFAVGYLYNVDEEGNITFEPECVFIGDAPNFMMNLKEAEEYTDEEIDPRYTECCDDEDCGCGEEGCTCGEE